MSDSKTMTIFVKADIENFSKNIANVEKNMNSVFGVKTMKMSKTFAKGLAAAASALGAFGAACIAMADHEQEVERTFTSLIGDADKAKKTLADLADWATNVPFDFEDMENASKKLLAYGVAAEDVVAVLNNLGNAAAMAAAALVELAGGSPEASAHACAMAIANQLGLVCDPVAGLVEIPCIKRNVAGVMIAFSSADMALAGIKAAIPVDECIDAMREVGDALPTSLKETAGGGLATTPTGLRLKEQVFGKA